jgi:hypothetical protein
MWMRTWLAVVLEIEQFVAFELGAHSSHGVTAACAHKRTEKCAHKQAEQILP